jgi:hypothetical protein
MKDYIKSSTTGKRYCPEDTIRILNIRQIIFYMTFNVEILDFYPSKDFKTGEDVMVFLVDKKDSQEAYKRWLESRHD